ncbi:MAG TPA: ABC transporter substrate-binding protein [Coleofasciculaceae cyanobacterium]|jgi:peptide/nickel transport system substrate-binding protein
MTRFLNIFAVFLLILSLAGCASPPKPGSSAKYGGGLATDGGKSIIMVEAKQKAPFRTVVQDGVEMLEARGEVGKFGGTFYDNQIGDGPKTFNYWASTDATSSGLGSMMLAGLVNTDPYTGEPYPYLAKDVKVSDDKMTYTVTLRKGLQWSDGQPITAKDVVFTWNGIIKKGFGNASIRDAALVEGKFPEIRAIDGSTVEFKTAKPFAPFIRQLGAPIAPEHVLKGVVAQGNDSFSAAWGVTDASKHPERFVSSGMWLLEGYDPRQRATFKRNPKFFMVDQKAQRLPYLDRYVINFVGDINNEALQFEQGKSDTFTVPGNLVSHMRSLKRPTFSLYNQGPASGTIFLVFNLSNRKGMNGKPQVDPIRAKWFNDVNFRQAVNHAINREDIVANILKGVGAPLYTSEALSSIYLNQNLAKGFSNNIEEAKALLKKSDYSWNAQGRLMDKDGHPVEFTLYTNSGNTEREAVGVNLKQDLDDLGIKVNFKPIDFNVLVGKLRDGEFESMIMGLTGSNLEPHDGVNVWKSDGFMHLFNQRKVAPGKPTDISDRLPWEKQLDELFEKGAQDFDQQRRKEIYDRYQEVVYQQVPLIYLYSPLRIVAVRDRIRNFDPTPLESFHNMEEIWIDDSAGK